MKIILLVFSFLIANFIARADSFQVFEENGKVGIKDDQGKIVIPASFDALGWSDGSFSVIGDVTGYRLNNAWGLLNLKKESITKADFDELVHAGADNIIVRKRISPIRVKAACLNLRGDLKIPFLYDGIRVHGLRAVVFNLEGAHYQYGLVDLMNRVLLPVQYKNIYPLGSLRYAVENFNSKIALYAEDGKAVTPFKIDSISSYFKNKAIIYEGVKQGLIDRDGVIKLEPVYRNIRITEEGSVWAQPSHEWLFLNDKNETVASLEADDLLPVSSGQRFIIVDAGKYGVLDKVLKTLVPPQYDLLQPLKDNIYLARYKGKAGVIREDNSIIIPFSFDSLIAHGTIFRCYRKIEGWSLLDWNNKFLTTKNYDWIGPGTSSLLPVTNNSYWGVLTDSGEEVIHCVYDSILDIYSKQVLVKFKGQYGIINTNEDWLAAPQSFHLSLLNDSCYLQHQPGNLFLKDFKGNIRYFTSNKLQFEKEFMVESLPDGSEKKVSYQGLILSRTAPLQLDKLEKVFPVSEGFRGIKRDGKYGFVDERGRLRIANRYDGIGEFHEGLGAVKLLGKWGFIDMRDQIVINPTYESVKEYRNGLVVVRKNAREGIIDKQGKIVLELHYDSVIRKSNDSFRLVSRELKGLADAKGSILIEPRFTQFIELSNDRVIVSQGNKFGLVTLHGLSVIPVIYDSLAFDADRNQYLARKKSEWREMIIK